MVKRAIAIVFVFRFAGYVYTYFNPFAGLLLSFFLDAADSGVFYYMKVPMPYYHKVDKIIDYIQYVMLIPIVYTLPIFNIFCIFLGLRTIGLILFYYLRKVEIFILFPNFVDIIVFIYFTIEVFALGLGWDNYILWSIVFVLKMALEISFHGTKRGHNSYYLWESIESLWTKFNHLIKR